jgi:hypothetical protein
MAKQPTTPVKPKAVKLSRFEAATTAIKHLTEPTTLTALNQVADDLYAKAGGKSSPEVALYDTKRAVKAAEGFGLVTVNRAEVVVTPTVKP